MSVFGPPDQPGSGPPLTEPGTTKEDVMQKYRCTVCGYIYVPDVGDIDSGVAPGTAFEDLPEDWVCPICGVDKSMFEPE